MNYAGTPGQMSQSWNNQDSQSGASYDDYAKQMRSYAGQAVNAQLAAGNRPRSYGSATGYGLGYGGQQAAWRPVSEAPIWSGQQIDQRVNLSRARGDQALGAHQVQNQRDLASRGFATANSPLLKQLNNAAWGQNLGAQTAGENDLRWNAAQGNAAQTQRAQMANQQAFGSASQTNAELDARRRSQLASMQQQDAYAGSQDPNRVPLLQMLMQLAQPTPFSRQNSQQGNIAMGDPQASTLGTDMSAYFS